MDADWEDAAVDRLCVLCSDEWAGVRDWATFKFRISDVDSDEIRLCLRARLHDPDQQTRAEAICALARRRDLACLKQLIDDLGNLDARDDFDCHIEAAHKLVGCGPEDERSPEELRDELVRMYPLRKALRTNQRKTTSFALSSPVFPKAHELRSPLI
jgi:hypothetical protein